MKALRNIILHVLQLYTHTHTHTHTHCHTHTHTHTYCHTHTHTQGADFPGLKHARYRKRGRIPSNGDPHPKPKDGCRKKLDYTTKQGSNKPPLSYASMISLAICSTPQRMMTLSSIYRWMESTFPFYRTPEAKAWKVCGVVVASFPGLRFFFGYTKSLRPGNEAIVVSWWGVVR